MNDTFRRVFALLLAVVGLSVAGLVGTADGQVASPPAFPGAEGFGAGTVGGRGGDVYIVNKLTDTGEEGTLRHAVEETGPRIVVFAVGGTINLLSELSIDNPNITIAGQTAPGDGIAIQDSTLKVKAGEVIIRGLRSRPGDKEGDNLSAGQNRDAIALSGSSRPVSNVIIDHSSLSWAPDETLQMWGSPNPISNVTVQYSIISESLHDSIHIDEGATETAPHGMGVIVDGTDRVTLHHNLLANHHDRNPLANDVDRFEFVNNVVYNWRDGPAKTGGDPTIVHFIANNMRGGPGYRKSDGSFQASRNDSLVFSREAHPSSAYYLDGNTRRDSDGNDPEWNYLEERSDTAPISRSPVNGVPATVDDRAGQPGTQPFAASGVLTHDAGAATTRVINDAGAVLPRRDLVDQRAINDFESTGGFIINKPEDRASCTTDARFDCDGHPILASGTAPTDSDSDGMPDAWETERGLNPNDESDSSGDDDGDGYTNIEEYINGLFDLKAHYQFDNTSDLGDDSSAFDNDLILNGLSGGAGRVGSGSATFDGSSTPTIESPLSIDRYTIAMWVKVDDMSVNRALFGGLSGHNLYPRVRVNDDGRIVWHQRITDRTSADSTFENVTTSGSVITQGQWHHVAVSLDDQTVARIYIDGAVVAERDLVDGYPLGGPLMGTIGTDLQDWGLPLVGSMDEIRIYNQAQSASDIAVLAQADPVGPTCDPVTPSADLDIAGVTTNSADVYELPDASCPAVSSIAAGTAVRVVAEEGSFYYAQFNGGSYYWVAQSDVDTSGPGDPCDPYQPTFTMDASGSVKRTANVYPTPDTSCDRTDRFRRRTSVRVVAEEGSFYYAQFNGGSYHWIEKSKVQLG